MTSDTDEEYPSVRRALFGDDHAANLYCGCKWLLWHLFHVLFVLVAIGVLAIFVPLYLVYRLGRYVVLRVGAWALSTIGPRARGVLESTADRATVAGETSKRTPITRRIYGYCPVGLKMDPRWFEYVSDFVERVADWAKPPNTVWVCPECGEVRDYDHEPTTGCVPCNEFVDWVKVRESEMTEVHPDASLEGDSL